MSVLNLTKPGGKKKEEKNWGGEKNVGDRSFQMGSHPIVLTLLLPPLLNVVGLFFFVSIFGLVVLRDNGGSIVNGSPLEYAKYTLHIVMYF